MFSGPWDDFFLITCEILKVLLTLYAYHLLQNSQRLVLSAHSHVLLCPCQDDRWLHYRWSQFNPIWCWMVWRLEEHLSFSSLSHQQICIYTDKHNRPFLRWLFLFLRFCYATLFYFRMWTRTDLAHSTGEIIWQLFSIDIGGHLTGVMSFLQLLQIKHSPRSR